MLNVCDFAAWKIHIPGVRLTETAAKKMMLLFEVLRREDKRHLLQTEACECVGHSSDALAVAATRENPRA